MSPAAAPDPELRRIGQQCLARKIRQASRGLSALYDAALRGHGLKVSQMNVLVAVGALGAPGPAALVKALDLEKSTVSRNVERLVASGWLEAVNEDEGRKVCYRLTRTGRGVLERALPDWEDAQAEARRRLGSAGLAALTALAGALGPRS